MTFTIEDKSGEFLDALAKEAKRIMRRLGKEAAENAKQQAPELSGKLKESIGSKVTPDSNGDLTLEVGASNYKAHWFEFGTRKMRARPFITPATENLGDDFNNELADAANNIRV